MNKTKYYLFKTPVFLQKILPKYLWRKEVDEKVIYLTFDDGPTPQVTEWVLDLLDDYQAKASFFLIGKNIKLHPKIATKIWKRGHRVGNHSYSHVKSKKTVQTFLEDVIKADIELQKIKDTVLQNNTSCVSKLATPYFRPPYGKITSSQTKALLQKGYEIVLWEVLSGDFDTELSPEKSLQKVLKHTKPGSIVVFHDSVKANKTLQYVLPKALGFWQSKGYTFRAL